MGGWEGCFQQPHPGKHNVNTRAAGNWDRTYSRLLSFGGGGGRRRQFAVHVEALGRIKKALI